MRRTRIVATVLAAGVGLGAVAGCSSDPNSVAAQAAKGDDKGYIAGDGTIAQVPPDQRGAPVQVSGTLLDGRPWSLEEAKGKVVVLNVWGSWCAPCQTEIPQLQAAWAGWQRAKAPVLLMGLDQKEGPESGKALLKAKKATYPSLADDGGAALLGLQGKVSSYPTTLVLDRQRRIAARVSGPVTTATITALVDDVLKGK
ncbi:TlpA family protein disulfide reductase [Calidifontibacter sp. DB0510]|uniref:TlpA family protein disulfide reductase n=1 Tax=Metallococcus carri TaxID=1656884 RepID=A0A967AZK2_9MICO|nr:TlpA disulfide reductase family protein [Metallococcus carri]NHN55312.1 TlpA family protein disulfide reductase [Metallococcus carri]NOP36389.1 TlpA family protein disulfide reductase [Calidifontibacter sp. DB2511S]